MTFESQQESGLSANEIVHFAKSYGFIVSKRQLNRWQNQGLFPRPKQLYQKGVAGSRSVYPLHAGEQAWSVCKIAEHFRAKKKIGWYLWRLGWPVDDLYWKPVFADAIKFMDDFLTQILENTKAPALPEFQFTDRFLDAVGGELKQPVNHPKAGPLKQRLGTDRFESLVLRCMSILVGDFSGDLHFEQINKSDGDLSLTNILKSAFAEDECRTEFITKQFEFLSDTVSEGTLVDQLRDFSANELQIASKEIANIDGMLMALIGRNDDIPKVNGIPAFSLKTEIREQAILILGWCVARRMQENAENLKKL